CAAAVLLNARSPAATNPQIRKMLGRYIVVSFLYSAVVTSFAIVCRFDHWITLFSAVMTPSEFQGGVALKEILLVNFACPTVPLSLLNSNSAPVWVTVKV